MSFAMTDEEILRSFNTAAHPSKQVAILADLNATDVETMCAKPKELDADYKKLPRQKKEKTTQPTEKKSVTKHTLTPAWVQVLSDLRAERNGYSARLDEVERQAAALQAENNALVHKLNALDTALAVLDELYGDKEG